MLISFRFYSLLLYLLFYSPSAKILNIISVWILTPCLFHLNCKISFGFLNTREKSLGLLELASKMKEISQQTFVLKTSWKCLSSSSSEDALIKTNIFALFMLLQKTPSRRLQDLLIKPNIFFLTIRLEDVFRKRL